MAGAEGEPTGFESFVPGGARRDSRRARGKAFDREQLFDSLQTAQVERPKALANAVGMRFAIVPAGTFVMGSEPAEPGHRVNEAPAHEVVLTKPFYLGSFPVTEGEYRAVVGRSPSANGADHPVVNVSWDDAVRFCKLLTDRPDEQAAGRAYRLPTEAEWEYGCRGGRTGPFAHADTLTADHANFGGGRPSAVGKYPANLFGLSDMHGNVWEWCADWYGEGYYQDTPLRDPAGPTTGKVRVLRGGSWRNGADRCRAAYRNALAPHQRDTATGFRVVLVMGE